MKPLSAIVLAAGRGTRMQSALPKVLHEIHGKPMLVWVLDALKKSAMVHHICLVLSKEREVFTPILRQEANLRVCVQEVPNGTGGACASAAPCFQGITPIAYASKQLVQGSPVKSSYVLICAGDVPTLTAEVIQFFLGQAFENQSSMAVLGMELDDPHGYGRLIVDEHQELQAIVEEKDATAEEKKITFCNSGIIFAQVDLLFSLLADIKPANAQQEYYLTDCIQLARQGRAKKIHAFLAPKGTSLLGVNNEQQKWLASDMLKPR